MSSAIVLLNLTTWAEQHISALYAATPNNFNTTFDEFISSNAKITLNGQSLSSDQYKGLLFSHQFEISGATVNYNGAVQVSDPSNPTLTGDVGIFFEAIKRPELGDPTDDSVTASWNLQIQADPSVTPPPQPTGVRGGGFDPRRVFDLNGVMVDQDHDLLD